MASAAAARFPRPRDGRRRRAVVSLTPLIDVVFILLVFFMLASSFIDWRAIDLGASGTSRGGGIEGSMLIDLGPEQLRLSGETLDLDAFATRVAARLAEKPDQKFVIRPVDGADVQRLIAVLDRPEAAGATRVELMTDTAPAGGRGS